MPEYNQYISQLESILEKDDQLIKEKIANYEEKLQKILEIRAEYKVNKDLLNDEIKENVNQETALDEDIKRLLKQKEEEDSSYEQLEKQLREVIREEEQRSQILSELSERKQQVLLHQEMKQEELAKTRESIDQLHNTQKETIGDLQEQHNQIIKELGEKSQTLSKRNREFTAIKRGNKEFLSDLKLLLDKKQRKYTKWMWSVGGVAIGCCLLCLLVHLIFFYVLGALLLLGILFYLYILRKYTVKAHWVPGNSYMESYVINILNEDLAAYNFNQFKMIKGGQYTMGDDGDYPVKAQKHDVVVSDFYMSKCPVTQRQWKRIMGFNPSRFKGDDLPVENVSWDDVQEFITRLNVRFPSYRRKKGITYRLPTEAEWEYAAKGGSLSKGSEFSGSDEYQKVAWLESNADNTTHSVGQNEANELGLFDMTGNVWEWCSDWYRDYEKGQKQTDPQGPAEGEFRILRGGCWNSNTKDATCATRNLAAPQERYYGNGFRLASSKKK